MVSNGKLVSVVVSTYNRSKLLKETILSILVQTYNNLELIVVDDGSTDNTEDVVKNIKDDRISYIKIKNWGGPARPRNIGISNAKGNYIAFCDDDDLWMPEKLERQLELFEGDEIIGVGAKSELFGEMQMFRNKKNNHSKEVEFYSFRDILIDSKSVPFSSLVVRKNEVTFVESKEIIYVEDLDYQLQLTRNGKRIAYINDPLIKYRKPLLTESYPSKSKNKINLINKYKSYFSEKEYRTALSNHYWYVGLKHLKTDQFKKAKLHFITSYQLHKSAKTFMALALSKFPHCFQKKALNIYYKSVQ